MTHAPRKNSHPSLANLCDRNDQGSSKKAPLWVFLVVTAGAFLTVLLFTKFFTNESKIQSRSILPPIETDFNQDLVMMPKLTLPISSAAPLLPPIHWLDPSPSPKALSLIIQAQSLEELSQKTLKALAKTSDWPSYVNPKDLTPRAMDRHLQGMKREVFIDYEWVVNGFKVPQGSVRVLLFEIKDHTFQVSLFDHHLKSAPSFKHAPLSLTQNQALALIRKKDPQSANQGLWRLSGLWTQRQKEWIPRWKIQFFGSPKIYYVNAIDGAIDLQTQYYGLDQQTSPIEKIRVLGKGIPLLAESDKTDNLPLPLATILTQKGMALRTDSQGTLTENLTSREVPSVLLKNESFEVKNAHRKLSLEAHWLIEPLQRSLIVNPKSESQQTAFINAYYYVEYAKNYLLQNFQFAPSPLSTKLVAKVNRRDEICNASYLNGTLNFDSESEECRNTAFDTIIFHEFTHYVDEVYGGIVDRALSEGMGDILATFISNQPVIGHDLFKGYDAFLRTTENEITYKDIGAPYSKMMNKDNFPQPPEDEVLEDTEEEDAIAYNNGQAWAAFAWRVRTELITKYGPERGKALAENLFIPLLETNPPDILGALNEVFARLGQGMDIESSPDFDLVESAAMHHGFFWLNPKNETKKFSF